MEWNTSSWFSSCSGSGTGNEGTCVVDGRTENGVTGGVDDRGADCGTDDEGAGGRTTDEGTDGGADGRAEDGRGGGGDKVPAKTKWICCLIRKGYCRFISTIIIRRRWQYHNTSYWARKNKKQKTGGYLSSLLSFAIASYDAQ